MRAGLEEYPACFETRAFRALLSMRRSVRATDHLILRSGPQDRVSKDARAINRCL
jgi:hypothetical protein